LAPLRWVPAETGWRVCWRTVKVSGIAVGGEWGEGWAGLQGKPGRSGAGTLRKAVWGVARQIKRRAGMGQARGGTVPKRTVFRSPSAARRLFACESTELARETTTYSEQWRRVPPGLTRCDSTYSRLRRGRWEPVNRRCVWRRVDRAQSTLPKGATRWRRNPRLECWRRFY
jgi:hypothetical protein